MGHVRRRKLEGGRTAYLPRYRGPDGHERSKQFAKRSDAERFLSVAEVSRAEGSWIDPAAEAIEQRRSRDHGRLSVFWRGRAESKSISSRGRDDSGDEHAGIDLPR